MSDEALEWLQYADENLKTARLCLEDRLFNPCIQNAQQTVEKALKALCIESGKSLRKTHSMAS